MNFNCMYVRKTSDWEEIEEFFNAHVFTNADYADLFKNPYSEQVKQIFK